MSDPARLPRALVRWFSELTHLGMFATDRELRVIVWNRWLEIHARRSAADAIGRSVFDLFPDLASRGLEQAFRDALCGRISVVSHGLHRYLFALPPTHEELGFDEMPQSAQIGPLWDGDEVIGTVATIEDISDRIATESVLRKQIEVQQLARGAAEQALRAKDEFLSTVSHEIRNPLNAVLGWTRILLDRPDADAETRTRALRVIDRNATAQVRMIDDLLDVARIVAGKLRLDMQPVDLGAITTAAADMIAPEARVKQIVIRSDVDRATPMVLGDPQRLQQIVWNLLSNAVKFSDAGGSVVLRVAPAGGRARLVVADGGHGISAEFLPFVFERFRQSDASSTRRHGGLGLGLALVRKLVERHGGTVRADSAGANLGATFTVDLPAVTAGLPAPRPPVDAEPASLDGVRVLVVEHEADASDLLVEILSGRGAAVVASSSCREAFAALERMADALPHVIVTDLGLPQEDGYALIRRLRDLPSERGGAIPVVAVTGDVHVDDRPRALGAGFVDHLQKPIEPRAVAVAIARGLSRVGRGAARSDGPA